MSNETFPTVTAYVTAFRNEPTIARCIQSIRNQTVKPIEILTVEDGHAGNDASLAIAKRFGVRVLDDHAGENRGLPASCNTALKHATSPLFLKVDGDVELAPNWIEKAAKNFVEDDAIVGVCGRMFELHTASIQGQWRDRFMRQEWGGQSLHGPQWLFGAAGLFKTEAIRSLGGWNEKYRFNYQDVELSQRIKTSQRYYEASAISRHLLQSTLAEVMENGWRWFKHPDDAGYESIEAAAQNIFPHFIRAFGCDDPKLPPGRLRQCMGAGLISLSYPCLLHGYWCCMEDIDYIRKAGRASDGEAKATQLACWELADRQMANMGVSPSVRCRFGQDMHTWRKGRTGGAEPNAAYVEQFSKLNLAVDDVTAYSLETSVLAMEAGDREMALWHQKPSVPSTGDAPASPTLAS